MHRQNKSLFFITLALTVLFSVWAVSYSTPLATSGHSALTVAPATPVPLALENRVLTSAMPAISASTSGPTSTATSTPTHTPTSQPGPPALYAPEDGAVLPQPVPPNEWEFRWQARMGPCYTVLGVSGPPGGAGFSVTRYPYEGYSYRYTTDEYIPNNALGPYHWSVGVVCPLGMNHSESRTFWVEPAPSVSPTPLPTFTPTGTLPTPTPITPITPFPTWFATPQAPAYLPLVLKSHSTSQTRGPWVCPPEIHTAWTPSALRITGLLYDVCRPTSSLNPATLTLTVTPTITATPATRVYLPLIRRSLLPDLVGKIHVALLGFNGRCVPSLQVPVELRSVSVGNVGGGPSGPFVVRANDCVEWELDGLAAGQWLVLGVPDGVSCLCPCQAKVDADDEVVESDEANNQVWSPTLTPPATCTPAPMTTPTPTATVTPQPVCTAPACDPDEVLYCPGECPGGCGYRCATRTPTPNVSAERTER